jgi:hypothetical protein
MKNGIIIDGYGTKRYYKNNKLHRIDGPAIERADGTKHWWINGKRHRLDGPAVENSGGTKEWWIDSQSYSEEEYPHAVSSYKSRVLSQILASCP